MTKNSVDLVFVVSNLSVGYADRDKSFRRRKPHHDNEKDDEKTLGLSPKNV